MLHASIYIRRLFQSVNLKFAGNEQTLPEPINKKMCDFLSLLFMDSVTERNLNHDLRVKKFLFLGSCDMYGRLNHHSRIKKIYCGQCKERNRPSCLINDTRWEGHFLTRRHREIKHPRPCFVWRGARVDICNRPLIVW